MRNNEITIHMSIKRKDGTRGSTQTIHKDSCGTKWTVNIASGKTFKMSPEQLLSHVFKAILCGKTIIDIVTDLPESEIGSVSSQDDYPSRQANSQNS